MSNKQATEKIAGLETRLEELEADVTASAETIENLQAEAATNSEAVASITAERDQLTTDLATAEATITDQETTITEANAKLETFDDEVETKAQNKIASLGFKGEIPGSSTNEDDSTKTRAEFNALNPAARLAYVQAGGKIK